MRLSLAAACGVALATATPAAARELALPSPSASLRAQPPVQSPDFTPAAEHRLPGPVDASIAVRTTVDSKGRVLRVVAVDSLRLHGTGDYSFVFPAPAVSVVSGPGSQSQPGFRTGAVLWQGFAARGRRLVASIVLDPRRASPAVPLSVEARGDHVVLRNATVADASARIARVTPAAAARALDDARGGDLGSPSVDATGRPRVLRVHVFAPVRVQGSYRLGGAPARTIDARLTGAPLRLPGNGPLRSLRLRVSVEDARVPLEPPAGRSWRAFARRGGLGPDPAAFAARRLLESALARQYERFLVNPDPTGPTRTSYTVALGAASAAPAGHRSRPWLALGFALAALAALAAGVVAWAHS